MNLLVILYSAVADLAMGAVKVARPKRPEKPKNRRRRREDRRVMVLVAIMVAVGLVLSWLLDRGQGWW